MVFAFTKYKNSVSNAEPLYDINGIDLLTHTDKWFLKDIRQIL